MPTFPRGEQNYLTADISHTFCRSATKFGSVMGLANRNLFPEFREIWSWGPVIPCGDMHQSFTDAIVNRRMVSGEYTSRRLSFTVFVRHTHNETDDIWPQISRTGVVRRGIKFDSSIKRTLLYITTQIGELWPRKSPWEPK